MLEVKPDKHPSDVLQTFITLKHPEIEPLENLSVKVAVDNLFDEEFYTNSFADVWVEPGAPQRFRLTAAYRF